jgi:hypothetical protein
VPTPIILDFLTIDRCGNELKQDTDGTLFLAVRTGESPAPMMPLQVRAIHQVDHPNLDIRNESVMDERINDSPAAAFLNRSSARLAGSEASVNPVEALRAE